MEYKDSAEGVRDRIYQNYVEISNDHIAHWRANGVNPWQDDEHVYAMESSAIDFVLKHSKPGDKVLDAGCAMGSFIRALEAVSELDVYGCDFSAPYIAVAHELGTTNTVVAELEQLPYASGYFDVVVSTDVLEHVVDPNTVAYEMVRVLRPGGVLVVRTPEYEDLAGYLTPEYPYRYTHFRTFSAPALELFFNRLFNCDLADEPLSNRRTVTAVFKKPE